MTRKKNAEPCPRCKLIRQEWKRGFGYSQCLFVRGEGVYDGICHDCARRIGNDQWWKMIAEMDRKSFEINEMWSLERGAL